MVNVIEGVLLATALAGTGLLAGFLPAQRPSTVARGEAITISRGPCFGFCPVYTVSISPGGHVNFEGKRYTAVLGTRSRTAGREAYRQVRQSLASLRPRTGRDQEIACAGGRTDASLLTVEWLSSGGTRTVLRYNMGCQDKGRIEQLLKRQLRILDVADWAAQQNQPNHTRAKD